MEKFVDFKVASADVKLPPTSAVNVAVAKAIKDSLKDLTDSEINSQLDDEGFTCLQRLFQQKSLSLSNNGKQYPCGANFYKLLRKTFKAEARDPSKQLASASATEAAPQKLPICPKLAKGMEKFVQSRRKGPFLNVLQLHEKFNAREVKGMFSFALECKPFTTNPANTGMAKALLKLFVEHGVAQAFPLQFSAVRDWCDDTLCFLSSVSLNRSGDPLEFLHSHRQMCELVLDGGDLCT